MRPRIVAACALVSVASCGRGAASRTLVAVSNEDSGDVTLYDGDRDEVMNRDQSHARHWFLSVLK